ncbi:TIGR03943 family protein [Streptomyces sp. CC219B]|uniref:TIGR03943 family putative permease subunit n=1 Tax=Streptomyces sp. CC219B TaxID=3044574 RepID=UPI0024A8E8F4|nr:TIGR03943 family protein [Streptomyces sp. CC219B]
MRRYGPAALLLLTGGAVLRISLFGDLYLRYVQPGLRPYLIVSGVALVLLGAVSALTRRHGGHEAYEDDGHGHQHGPAGPRVAWLLTLPALALLLFPPPALGSYSAEREAAERSARGIGTFPALPSADPVELTLGEYTSRAIYDSERSLTGRTLRLTGFVTHDDDGARYVTRLLVACCAADATTSKVEIRGADALPDDTWITVTGTWKPEGDLGSEEAWPPVLEATSVERVEQPANPYEKR